MKARDRMYAPDRKSFNAENGVEAIHRNGTRGVCKHAAICLFENGAQMLEPDRSQNHKQVLDCW